MPPAKHQLQPGIEQMPLFDVAAVVPTTAEMISPGIPESARKAFAAAYDRAGVKPGESLAASEAHEQQRGMAAAKLALKQLHS